MDALLLLLSLLLLIGFGWFATDTVLGRRRFNTPYLRSPSLAIPIVTDIVRRRVPNTADATFVEPGAGLALVSRHMSREFAWKEVVALELSALTHFRSKLLSLFKPTNIRLAKSNALAFAYPRGSVVYSYLFTELLAKLHGEGKLRGCLVISLTFAIPGIAPDEEHPLDGWQGRMLVYDFREK